MPTISTLALFLIAALGLVIIPGPSVMYIIACSVDQGRQAGMISALGIAAGNIAHVTAATLGLSALLMSSALAFMAVKYAGAAYLIYLGIRTLLTRAEHQPASVTAPRKLRRIFSQGLLVNLLNPKTALFFLAFLPQFVDPARGTITGQILLFGGLLALLGICSDNLYALLAGTAGAWLKGNQRFLRAQRYVAGSMYIALGISAAFAGPGKK